MKKKLYSKKGQATLETAVAFIMTVIFLGGVFNVWLWANNQIVKRQLKYNRSRVAAGTSSDLYVLRWPVHNPETLSENEVIRGN